MKVHIQEINLHISLPQTRPLISEGTTKLLSAIMERAAHEQASAPDGVQPPARVGSEPALGELWPEQGGIYAGLARHEDGRHYHLIVASAEAGEHQGIAWGVRGDDIAGAASKADGAANTGALLEVGSDLAKWVTALSIAGHDDWYVPSQRELALAWINAPATFKTEGWYWTSTQYSRSYAWAQHFADGGQLSYGKGLEFRARAVRRFFLE